MLKCFLCPLKQYFISRGGLSLRRHFSTFVKTKLFHKYFVTKKHFWKMSSLHVLYKMLKCLLCPWKQYFISRGGLSLRRHFVKTKLFHKYFVKQKTFSQNFEKCCLCTLKAFFGINQFIRGQRQMSSLSLNELVYTKGSL